MFNSAGFAQQLKELPDGAPRTIVQHESVDSTSSDLLRLVKQGAPAGTVVVAEHQTRGRGRQGRSWHSPLIGNLYISLAVDISHLSREQIPLVPLVGGVALAKTVSRVAGAAVRLKWPNNLLLEGKKLAGLLCELPLADAPILVAGLGLNVGAMEFPDELASTAVSLAVTTTVQTRERVAALWIGDFEERLEKGLAEDQCRMLIDDWCSLAEGFGRMVKVGDIIGETVGLSPAGQLLVQVASGEIVPVPGGVVENL